MTPWVGTDAGYDFYPGKLNIRLSAGRLKVSRPPSKVIEGYRASRLYAEAGTSTIVPILRQSELSADRCPAGRSRASRAGYFDLPPELGYPAAPGPSGRRLAAGAAAPISAGPGSDNKPTAMQDPPKNIFAVVLDKIHAASQALVAEGLLPAGIDQSRVQVEPPREAAHGDMATNAAMVLAKDAGKRPRDLAEALAGKLRQDDIVSQVEVAGPGFINLTLRPSAWSEALRAVLRAEISAVRQ